MIKAVKPKTLYEQQFLEQYFEELKKEYAQAEKVPASPKAAAAAL